MFTVYTLFSSQDKTAVRAAAFTLFGKLSRFGDGPSKAPFLEQVHTNLISVLLHLNEEDEVTKVNYSCFFQLQEFYIRDWIFFRETFGSLEEKKRCKFTILVQNRRMLIWSIWVTEIMGTALVTHTISRMWIDYCVGTIRFHAGFSEQNTHIVSVNEVRKLKRNQFRFSFDYIHHFIVVVLNCQPKRKLS